MGQGESVTGISIYMHSCDWDEDGRCSVCGVDQSEFKDFRRRMALALGVLPCTSMPTKPSPSCPFVTSISERTNAPPGLAECDENNTNLRDALVAAEHEVDQSVCARCGKALEGRDSDG